MNQNLRRVTRLSAGPFAIAATALLSAGCGSRDNFAKVNGQVVTKDEYIQALERAPVMVPGAVQATQVNAGRYVLDQIVGKKVVMSEASKLGIMPSDAEVQKRYEVQRHLFEQQSPTKSFDEAMKEQGTSPKDVQDEMKYQMAETNLVAKQLGISDDEIKKAYETEKSRIGLPERVQLRMIMAPGDSKDLGLAQKMLGQKVDFNEVARQVNVPALKGSAGLFPQVMPLAQTPPAWQAKIRQTAEGAFFGPVDWPSKPGQPTMKALVKVEKKYSAFTLPYEDAKPLIKQQLAQMRMQDPRNNQVKMGLLKMKLDADFQASDPKYQAMWQAAKDAANKAGVLSQAGAPVGALPGPGK